ncbi:MAG: hypothetical protein MZU84_09290 [Sphingobacterium sp.]|nr:hypothetical protein [Sphingobacterium sp.]
MPTPGPGPEETPGERHRSPATRTTAEKTAAWRVRAGMFAPSRSRSTVGISQAWGRVKPARGLGFDRIGPAPIESPTWTSRPSPGRSDSISPASRTSRR